MTVLMHCGRHEGADVNLLNTDVDRIRVAPPTSSVAIMALRAFSRGSRSRLAGGCNTSNVRLDDVGVEDKDVTSDKSHFWRVGRNSV
jgi:hypothetical protein